MCWSIVRLFPISGNMARSTVCWFLCWTALLVGSRSGNLCAQENDEAALRREVLARYIPRHRRLRESQATIDQLRTSGRVAETLKALQWVFDQPYDTLTRVQGEFVSVKRLAELQLRSFPADWREQYERTYGFEARRLLDDAKLQHDDRLAIEVLRRFPTTSVANEAAIWLALRWLDLGEPELALAAVLRQGHSSSDFESQNSISLKIAYVAAQISQNQRLLEDLLKEIEGRSEKIDLTELPVVAPPENSLQTASLAEEALLASPPRRTTKSSTSWRETIPVLHPRWISPLTGPGNSPRLTTILESWQGQMQEANLVPVVPVRPLVVRGQVVYRDYHGISGCDLVNGHRLWTFPCESSISTWIEAITRNGQYSLDRGNIHLPETLQWWFGSNTQLGMLSSDGIRIYALDSMEMPELRPGGFADDFSDRLDRQRMREESNRLLAFELPPVTSEGSLITPKLAWSSGRSQPVAENRNGARYFLGPPLPSAGRLLCLAETDREIQLMALHPETGAVMWEQPLAAADRSVISDGERAFLAYQPIDAGDVILCPTGVGVLAAVDAVTGFLRWSYYDHDLPPETFRRGRHNVISRGRPGFAPSTIVHGHRVVHLPISSSYVHCLDLETGRGWTKPRQRACLVAQVTDDVILLLEDRGCRALRLADGTEVWRTPLDSVSGVGLDLGTEYLVPLEGGRFALLESSTGRKLSWQPARPELSLGNLTACGDVVLSVDPFHVTAFPQAQVVRRKLNDRLVKWSPVERLIFRADLCLTEGDLAKAEQFLDSTLKESLPANREESTKHLLRELLYERLSTASDAASPILSRLQMLAETPEERGRLLAQQAKYAVRTSDAARLTETLRAFSRLPVEVTFQAAEEPGWRQSASACCIQLLAEIEETYPEVVREFQRELLDPMTLRVANSETMNDWRFALRVCNQDPAILPWRSDLARSLEQSGQHHVAELLWLQTRSSNDRHFQAEAMAGIARLENRAGWTHDAAMLLRELSGPWGDATVENGVTGRQVLDRLPPRHPARQWQRRIAPPATRLGAALIHWEWNKELSSDVLEDTKPSQRPVGNLFLGEFRNDSRDQRIVLSDPLSVEVLVRDRGNEQRLLVFDRSVSQVVHEWPIGNRHVHQTSSFLLNQGHFIPLATRGEFRGYSLLHLEDEEPVWKQRPKELNGRQTMPALGPGGPTFLTFQVQNRLYVCDPWDGAILWQRETLEPQSGLSSESRSGIVGDEHCLVVFAPDRTNYVMYETMSGRVLRTGRLDQESRSSRWAFGRKVFSVSQIRGQWMLRGWDPWENNWELEEPLGDRNTQVFCYGSPEIAWLTPEGDLRFYDMVRSQVSGDVHFPAEELSDLSSMKIMTSEKTCFVNLWRNSQHTAQTIDYNHPLQELLSPTLPQLQIRDDLYGVDRQTGKILWKRAVPVRNVLPLEIPGNPILVLACRVNDAHDTNRKTLLVEVVDAATGNLLGRNDHLPVDHILNVEYNGEDPSVDVVCQHGTVRIQLVPSVGDAETAWDELPVENAAQSR